ncbi:MAG: hypothetical protein O3C57_00210 [Verrucomicrobia bacterium]|nr:hypothetical protein [Verrucomicrobiota bacterium]
MHRHFGFTLACLVAALTMPARAEIKIIGDVIIENGNPQPMAGPIPVQPMRVIAVPQPTRSENGQAQELVDEGPHEDAITLLNKDVLRGTLIAIHPDAAGLTWQHPNVKSKIDFDISAIDKIVLGDRTTVDATASAAQAYLTNGDMFKGTIKALTAEHLILSTWYAGDINIKREMLSRLQPNAAVSDLIYSGPTDFAQWTHKNAGAQPSWQFKEDALYAMHSFPIGRQIPNMPDKASIEFEVAWRGFPQFYFSFFSDNVQHYSGNCYLLQVSGQSIYLQRYSSNAGSQNLGNANVERFQQPTLNSAVFTLLVDKQERKLVLLVDGEIVRQWNDPNPFGGLGNGILFQPQEQGNLKVSNIRIREWDGKMPSTDDTAKVDEDRIHFVNSDKVTGTLNTIADGQVSFATAYATLTVPIERVAEISFSPARTHRARRNKYDLRASFKDAGQVTVNLEVMDTGSLQGKSENFGDIKIPMQAFSEVQFNIYKERKEKSTGPIFE